MATSSQIAGDHKDLDEKRASVSQSGASVEYVPAEVGSATALPSLHVLMQYAQQARAREAGLGPGESFGTPTLDPNSDNEKKAAVVRGPPDIDEDLINARRALRTASWFAIFYLITTDILGPFNAPFAFSQVGYVPGAILYVVMGVVACYTGLILWKLFCALDSEHYPVRTYADLGERIFGTWFKNMCTVLQSLQLIINVGTICLSNAQSVAQIAVHNEFCFSIQILIWALFGMIIGQIRSLKNYGWFANMAVWLNLLTIFITMGVVAHSSPNFAGANAAFGLDPGPISKTAFTHLPLFDKVNGIMNMVFAYGGAMIFPEFMAEMRRPMDFWKGMCCAQLLIGTVYMMFGLFVYSFQGQFTLPLAYQGMSSFAWQTVGNALALVTGIIAAGLYGNIGIKVAYYQIVEGWFKGPPLMSRKGWYIWSVMVLLYWALAFIVGKEFEEKLIKHIWRTRTVARKSTPSVSPSINLSVGNSEANLNEKVLDPSKEQLPSEVKPPPQRKWWSWRLNPKDKGAAAKSSDPEKKRPERKLMLLGPFYAGCGAALSAYFMTAGAGILLQEFALDRNAARFGLVATLPIIFCISVFFCLQLIGNLSLIFGPVAQYHENSKYYSAVKPDPNPEIDHNLPHITIQMPVYKESLELTIQPSVLSIKKAMQTYARQGGTSAIFICDDGMQVLPEIDQLERKAFYANHNIGWTARPGHSSKPEGFKRAGKFKKASNMNYALNISLKLEKHLAKLLQDGEDDTADECLEDRALKMAMDEVYADSGNKFMPWGSNGKSLRMGEIILIVDSDTVVPEDCFRDAAREMGESPDVAIIQHESDVMQVAHHYFENGITHFTRRINKCISLGCANGEVAPFVGHNAFLRWSAVQDASFIENGSLKQWSEANVSEDFNMALRLLLRGYTLRWATYSEGGFKEGVSLTVVDELARWQKYAYGCNEIIFNPLIRWWRQGPISSELRGFVWSKAPVHYKIGMMSYMFSYYGIAAATIGSIINYLILGLGIQVDRFYLHSFEILLACTVVFPGVGNLGYTLLEYRLGHRSFLGSLFENLRWVPFFVFFFGGLSIHLSTALLAHLFSYDMTWGSTGKEVERSTFWIEVPRIWQRFKLSFIICFLCMVMMIIFTTNIVPFEWQIPGYQWALIIPLSLVVGCHVLFPIVLNPWLMIFSY